MRRAAVILVLIAAGTLLAACGKSAHFAGSKAGAAGSTPAGKVLSRSEAKALAPKLNLQASDLPGFSVSSEGSHERETPAEKGLERKLLRCIGSHGAASVLAEASSKSYERKLHLFTVSVGSSVTIEPTAAQASDELAAIRSSHTRTCLKSYVDELFSKETKGDAVAKLVSLTEATPPSSGTSGAYAWRIAGQFTLRRVHLPFYIELVGFAYGQIEVQMLSYGLPAPFPARAESDLFTLLVQRAIASGSPSAGKVGRGGKAPKAPSVSGPHQVQISL